MTEYFMFDIKGDIPEQVQISIIKDSATDITDASVHGYFIDGKATMISQDGIEEGNYKLIVYQVVIGPEIGIDYV